MTMTVDADGNFRFKVVSNGMSHREWLTYLGTKGFSTHYVYWTLFVASQAPTNGVEYDVVVLSGDKFSPDGSPHEVIRAYTTERGWVAPHWEVACLARDMISDDDLREAGFCRMIIMHDPIPVQSDMPFTFEDVLLSLYLGRQFYSLRATPVCKDETTGFAFVVPPNGKI